MKEIFDKEKISFRTFVIFFAVIVSYISIVLYLFYLQIFKGKYFFRLSQNNYCKIRLLFSPRGIIRDRNNQPLVVNELKFRVILLNKKYEDLPDILSELQKNLHLDMKFLIRKINQSYFSVIYIFDSMEALNHWQTTEKVKENLLIEECWIRKNLYSSLNHLTGYMKYDQLIEVPMKGLEKTYNSTLEGKCIEHKIFVDTHKNIIQQSIGTDYENGEDLRTTICLEGQKEGERLMNGMKGGLLVINGKGEVLVHLSSPYLEVYNNINKRDNFFLNKILQERYAPGSIFKIISSLVLLKTGFKPVICTGSVVIGGRKFHCWQRSGHGLVDNVETALRYSCNPFFYENCGTHSDYLNIFTEYLLEFGFMNKTQRELPEEIKSPMTIENKRTQIMMASIGQGTAVSTIIQNAVFIHRIVTGYKITPRFTFNMNNKKLEKKEKLKIPEEHLNIIRSGLYKNFEAGTCSGLAIPGLRLCGKTSTSQVMSLNAKNYKKENSIFVGSAPDQDLYVSVLVENKGFGSAFAGKIAVQILKYLANLENVNKKD